ncbi:transcriptional activator NhaR [Piscinibacter koreensis]|uniref:Transcriptional activator NhaR n=1 Tax=Piscinibacter koreensis TaxID=2742824 RepID=A0A7Y6NK69_9BURK|nr:transcriptional activator NhaR [Schlegelella koreensis]
MNYKHLHYFMQVAESGSVAAASRQLNLTPQTVSAQIQLLAERLGGPLFEKVGRRLQLTETGELALDYARQIFSLGSELEAAVRQSALTARLLEFRVGVADAVPKSIAYHLVEPALSVEPPVRIVCREWRLERLLAELAVHTLDLVISDSPLPPTVSVKAFSHALGRSRIGVYAAPALRAAWGGPFPECLNGAPLLMPGEDSAVGRRLHGWFKARGLRPSIVGEFDDSALAQEFGREGVGFYLGPDVLAGEIQARLQVDAVGVIDGVEEQFYAISIERRITHPCVLAITRAARAELFGSTLASRRGRAAARKG